MSTNAIAAALDSIALGPSVVVHNLTMIPLLAKPASTASTLRTPSTSARSTLSTSSTPSTLGTPSTLSTDGAVGEYVVLDEALGSGVVGDDPLDRCHNDRRRAFGTPIAI